MPCLNGSRTSYCAQNILVRLLDKFKLSLDEGGKAKAVLMDLSKAFDYIIHDLLIAKLHAKIASLYCQFTLTYAKYTKHPASGL